MTAHALDGDKEHYINEGMDDYVSKPIRAKKLIKALKNCYSSRH
jgi:CheY-like chemotaxis protein